MVHGILGSRKNMQAYARRLVEVRTPPPPPLSLSYRPCYRPNASSCGVPISFSESVPIFSFLEVCLLLQQPRACSFPGGLATTSTQQTECVGRMTALLVYQQSQPCHPQTNLTIVLLQQTFVLITQHEPELQYIVGLSATALHQPLSSDRSCALTQGFPSWQVLLVDIRCHGESANLPTPPGPHGVESAAQDILKLLSQLKLFPEVLIGHSFGGKVVMSMGEQFGASGKRLPRPVQVS